MKVSRPMAAVLLMAWTLSSGCTTMREIPPAQYNARPERSGLRVETRDGLVYTFDYATFDPDSLTGYHSRSEVEGTLDQVAVVSIALSDIQHLTSRSVNWTRTGLVGGGVIVGLIAAGVTAAHRNDNGSNTSGGGKGCLYCGPAFAPASGR